MSGGLATTFSVLSKTENESAVRVLLPALDSSNPTIKDGALAALLSRRNPAGQNEILRRIPSLSQRWKNIIQQHSGRLTGTMRDAVLGSDETLCTNACMAALMFGNYDMFPTLLTAMEDSSQPKADMAAETLMQLAVQLYDELAHPDESRAQHDPQWMHQHAVSCLETSVQRYGHHRRREVIEAFLLLVNPDNDVLNQILENPHHVCHLVLAEVMSRSSQSGVIRLLLAYLDKPQMPLAVLSVASNRCDLKFICELLHKVGRESSAVMGQNLKRMEIIAWLRNINNIADNLDDAAQHSLVQLVTAANIARTQVLSVIEYILQQGKPGGRREAALALAGFNGANANSLALRALNDTDPQVQANVLPQLRHRGIPGILTRLVETLDSPHLVVRQAARNALAEFSFSRFLGTFEMLDEETRKSTAALVKKIDQQSIPLLRKELQSPIRSRRLRGLQIVRVMNVADLVKDLVIDMLRDEDHILRAEAAETLGKCRSPDVISVLQEVLHDNSGAVREAALRSLNE